MLEELESRFPRFHTRLTETVTWCAGQNLNLSPIESAAIDEVGRLYFQAGKLQTQEAKRRMFWFQRSALRKKSAALIGKALSIMGNSASPRLRSPELRPMTIPLFPSTEAERVRVVETVADNRAHKLGAGKDHRAFEGLADGRLLLYSPDENLFDGAAMVASNGFFDVDNIPPWDTWVCFVGRYLVSWVPPQLLELANSGIEVNPEGCILWAPEVGLP